MTHCHFLKGITKEAREQLKKKPCGVCKEDKRIERMWKFAQILMVLGWVLEALVIVIALIGGAR